MTEQQNTRPSASREIAVKKLEWEQTKIYGQHLRDTARDMDGKLRYEVGVVPGKHYCLIQLPIGGGLESITCNSVAEAKAVAQADYERRILSAIDTTPGNTDPIAKYDDELRKVQGGWREDVDTDFICPPIPDRSHDWYARFKWHDGDTDLRGHGKTELDAVFDLFRNALDFDDGDGSEQETILDAAWLGIGGVSPTEHPTEQPSVKVAENGEVCKSPIRSKNHNGEEVVSFDERHTLADIARWISENPVDRDEMVHLLTGGQMKQPSVRDAARVLLDYLPNYAMENAALESRARDDEGEFASLSDLLDFSGQNKAYTVVREALAAALRSLAQEGE